VHVTELTGLLRPSPGGDQLKAWPKSMRVAAPAAVPPASSTRALPEGRQRSKTITLGV